jgi:drug/metabolite transporter (DMT)-like permease
MLLFLLLAAFGNFLYHVAQKTLAPTANPMVLLAAVYAVALAGALAAVPFFRTAGEPAWQAQVFAWPVLLLGVAVLVIEIGFLLAYRTGGSMQWSGVAVNGAAAVMLVPVALLLFGETFSAPRALGIVLTLGGLALMTR